MKKILFLSCLLAVITTATAGRLHKLHWTNGGNYSIHECLTTSPACETSSYLGQATTLLTNNASYGGHSYSINYVDNGLYYDGYRFIDTLYTFSFGTYQTLDVPFQFGFCIDKAGQGWLLSAWRDGDPYKYLWMVDINTGECTYVDVVDFGDPNWATGMYMIEL